jgi:hypothetical protein
MTTEGASSRCRAQACTEMVIAPISRLLFAWFTCDTILFRNVDRHLMDIIIENVRTFSGRHQIPIRPLTILTGENSSGKTAFLACLSVVSDPIGFPLNPEFNVPPYNLGSYDTIATYRGRNEGRSKSFSLGWTDAQGEIRGLATYTSHEGMARLQMFRGTYAGGEVTLIANRRGEAYNVSLRISGSMEHRFQLSRTYVRPGQGLQGSLLNGVMISRPPRVRRTPMVSVLDFFRGYFPPPATTSVAPIRTKPERTYEPGDDGFNPEGRHIPFVSARRLRNSLSKREWRPVLSSLEAFGDESGLFKWIGVKNLGKSGTDPFQILVNVAGRPVNLLDVGYGVSQSLPVVIESLFSSGNPILLVQQPEGRLHPRAQAALGSFFSRVAGEINANKGFVIETHSDYIVDRIRQEVARQTISQDSVLILYFERKGLSTTVYPLRLDPSGNILDAPKSYREFFLREEMSLLNRGF